MLKTKFLDVAFTNPVVLASGIVDVTAASMNRAVKNGCGGVTIKSISKEPREGHANPTMIGSDHYFLNAVGLANPGAKSALEELKQFKQVSEAPLIGSIFAGKSDEFAEVAEMICAAPIDFLEVDLSCPNVGREFGTPFAFSTEAVADIMKKVKQKSTVPVIAKLSPDAWNVTEIAKAAESVGSDAITAVNTMSGVAVDPGSQKPILHNVHGGVSGPALFPVALKCVYDIFEAVKIPIIGTGGITSGKDAMAMIMAGATLLGVGTAVYYRGDQVFEKICGEMKKIMDNQGIKNLTDVIGSAHTKD